MNLHVHDEVLALYRHGAADAGVAKIEALDGAWLDPGVQPGDLGVLLAAGHALRNDAAAVDRALSRAHPVFVAALSPFRMLVHVDQLLQQTGKLEARALLIEKVLDHAEDLELDADELRTARFLRAYVFSLRGDHDASVEAYRTLLDGEVPSEERPVLLNNLAWEQVATGQDYPAAHEVAREALRLSPGNPFIRFTFGATMLEAGGDPADALGYLEHRMETLSEVDPSHHARCLFYIAWAASKVGRGPLAEQARAKLAETPEAEDFLGRLETLEDAS